MPAAPNSSATPMFPIVCPKCQQRAGTAASVEVYGRHPEEKRVFVDCRACHHHWSIDLALTDTRSTSAA